MKVRVTLDMTAYDAMALGLATLQRAIANGATESFAIERLSNPDGSLSVAKCLAYHYSQIHLPKGCGLVEHPQIEEIER